MTYYEQTAAIETLISLMETLRDPVHGCAWDIAQTASSILPFTIEEAYEVADAIKAGSSDDLCEELGDLLFQVVFQAQIAREASQFDFNDVTSGIVSKLIRRHPHVVDGSGQLLDHADRIHDPDEVATIWNRIKDEERKAKIPSSSLTDRPLAGIARALPALIRAEKLSRRAASLGFDWSDPADVLAKVREEVSEVEIAMIEDDPAAALEEIGDLLFSVGNLARHLGIDPEDALRRGNDKFERRFNAMADHLDRDGHRLGTADLETMESAWRTVKEAQQKIE